MTYKFNIQPALRYAVWEFDDIDVTILVSFPTLSIRNAIAMIEIKTDRVYSCIEVKF